jgi:hypothetical protein
MAMQCPKFVQALRIDNATQVMALIRANDWDMEFDLGTSCGCGTMLTEAVRRGRLRVAKALLAAGANPDGFVFHSDGWDEATRCSALWLAVANENLPMTKLLLDAGADPHGAKGRRRSVLDAVGDPQVFEVGVPTYSDMYYREPFVVCLRAAGGRATTDIGAAAAAWIARRRLVMWRRAATSCEPVKPFKTSDLFDMVARNDRRALRFADFFRVSEHTLAHEAIRIGAAKALEWCLPPGVNFSSFAASAIDARHFECLRVILRKDPSKGAEGLSRHERRWRNLLEFVSEPGREEAKAVVLECTEGAKNA